MPYMTFAQVADEVGGVQRLVQRVYVGGHEDETAEEHPYFDIQAAKADRDVNVALDRGGYETPLNALTDPKLRNAWLGIFIGYASQSSSQREQWMKDLQTAGEADLANIANGSLKVTGATVKEVDTSSEETGIWGDFDESPLFALGDPYSGINEVAPMLPGPRRRWN